MSEHIFNTHKFLVHLKPSCKQIKIIIFSDVHRFADNCDVDLWKNFLQRCKTIMKRENVYFLGLGDYDDFASTSERAALKSSKLHDTTLRSLDDYARKNTEKFVEEIKFMKGRLIGLVEGNHNYTFMSGVTSTQLMCEMLGCKYLGWMAAIRVVLCHSNRKKGPSVDIAAHHGTGGGKRTGSSINNVEDLMRVIDANIYLMGHDHKKWLVDASKLYIESDKSGGIKIKQKDIILCRTGSYQLGYIPGKSSYPVSLAMPPSKRGSIYVDVALKRKIDSENFELSGGLM